MARHPGGERFTVEMQALPDDVPPAVRLRRWLKAALRSARMRALSVRETTPKPPATTPTASQVPAGLAEARGCPSGEGEAAQVKPERQEQGR